MNKAQATMSGTTNRRTAGEGIERVIQGGGARAYPTEARSFLASPPWGEVGANRRVGGGAACAISREVPLTPTLSPRERETSLVRHLLGCRVRELQRRKSRIKAPLANEIVV